MWPAVASPVVVGDMVIVCHGRNDRGDPRLHGVRLSGSGDVTATNHVWTRDDVSAFVPTPAVYQGCLYLVRDGGQIECLDPMTGETLWSDAFPKSRGKFYASPLIASGLLFAPREDGVVFVASVNKDRFDLLSENALEQQVIGSPVPAHDRLLIRGQSDLFCLGSPVSED
mgnify:CR=1 FL=1